MASQYPVQLYEYGCPVCGLLLDPAHAVDHPRAGKIHDKCADLLAFKGTTQRSPNELNPDAFGGGSAEYEED